jgi:predicted ATPase
VPAARLPAQLTSFVGREREVAEVRALLGGTRLLTLTGAGGSGKTRLALRVAADLLDAHPDGVWFVDLAPLSDEAQVAQAIVSALGLPDVPGRAPGAVLVQRLAPSAALLLLDNCEHLVAACARLADELLRACPRLRVLATSREVLGIPGELAWRVPSLSLPESSGAASAEQLLRSDAARLFAERARLVAPGFTVDDANASAVAEICRRLDGIPLAIELAAARVRVLAVEQIAARLNDRLRLLAGGGRTALPRQQAIRAAIDWSHELLSAEERALLRRLSVFAGGWTLEAAEAVCAAGGSASEHQPPAGDEADVLDLLTRLVDKSLVQVDERHGAARYRFLETIREYALEQLVGSGDGESVRGAHAAFFADLIRGAMSPAWSSQTGHRPWLVASEYDNVRLALGWLLDRGDAQAAVDVAGRLFPYWYGHGPRLEGHALLARALALPEADAPNAARAQALIGAANMAMTEGKHTAAETLLDQAAATFRALDQPLAIANALGLAGYCALARGDVGTAWDRFHEAMEWSERSGDALAQMNGRVGLGDAALLAGDHATAAAHYGEADRMGRRDDMPVTASAWPLRNLAYVALRRGDAAGAFAAARESSERYRQGQNPYGMVECLVAFAGTAAARGQLARAVRLLGAADAQTHVMGGGFSNPVELAEMARVRGEARAALGDEACEHARAEGAAMTLEQAVALSLSDQERPE